MSEYLLISLRMSVRNLIINTLILGNIPNTLLIVLRVASLSSMAVIGNVKKEIIIDLLCNIEKRK